MSKHASLHLIVMPSDDDDQAVLAAAADDPDAQPLTDAQLAQMVPLKTLRGRPKAAAKKQLVSVRFSPEVVDWFRSTGDGWQARMDRVLRDYVAQHSA